MGLGRLSQAFAPLVMTYALMEPAAMAQQLTPQQQSAKELQDLREQYQIKPRTELYELLNDDSWYKREAATRALRDIGKRDIQKTRLDLPWKSELDDKKDDSLERRKRIAGIRKQLIKEVAMLRWEGMQVTPPTEFEREGKVSLFSYIDAVNREVHGALDYADLRTIFSYAPLLDPQMESLPTLDKISFWELAARNSPLYSMETDNGKISVKKEIHHPVVFAYNGALSGRLTQSQHNGALIFLATDPGIRLYNYEFVSAKAKANEKEYRVTQEAGASIATGPYLSFPEELANQDLIELEVTLRLWAAPVETLRVTDLQTKKDYRVGSYIFRFNEIHPVAKPDELVKEQYQLLCEMYAVEDEQHPTPKPSVELHEHLTAYTEGSNKKIPVSLKLVDHKNEPGINGVEYSRYLYKKPTLLDVRMPNFEGFHATDRTLKFTFNNKKKERR